MQARDVVAVKPTAPALDSNVAVDRVVVNYQDPGSFGAQVAPNRVVTRGLRVVEARHVECRSAAEREPAPRLYVDATSDRYGRVPKKAEEGGPGRDREALVDRQDSGIGRSAEALNGDRGV